MAWGSSSCRPTAEETERRCSSMLLLSQHKVQREATPNVKRPKLPLPPHGFHTYEAEYERKTTVTSCIIYLAADIWFQSSCRSISANKPNAVLHKFLPAQRVISSHVCRLYRGKRGQTSHFIQVEAEYKLWQKTPKPRAELEMKETSRVAVVWYGLAFIWLDEVQVLYGNMWDPECMCACDPEDVHHDARHNGGVEWEGLGWGLGRYRMTSTQSLSFTQQQSTRPKTWQVEARHLCFQGFLLSVKAAGMEGFFVRVWSVDPKRKVQRQGQTLHKFLSFNDSWVREDWSLQSGSISQITWK